MEQNSKELHEELAKGCTVTYVFLCLTFRSILKLLKLLKYLKYCRGLLRNVMSNDMWPAGKQDLVGRLSGVNHEDNYMPFVTFQAVSAALNIKVTNNPILLQYLDKQQSGSSAFSAGILQT